MITSTRSELKWWEWLGWAAPGKPDENLDSHPEPSFNYTPNKIHNVWFGMASVSALFIYVGLVLSNVRK